MESSKEKYNSISEKENEQQLVRVCSRCEFEVFPSKTCLNLLNNLCYKYCYGIINLQIGGERYENN